MQKYVALIFLLSLLWSCEKDEESPVIVKACFSFEFSQSNDGEVSFINCSENAISYYWEFGDGETSTETNPVHTYTTEPPYYVSLIASSRYQKDTFMTQLYIGGIEVLKPNIYLYPT
ncbi:MAG: PKD domain-containing protein, partial [Bacteroidales bacterium]|nr:PKD domain-containing protein [Bacteroidales bacterium]